MTASGQACSARSGPVDQNHDTDAAGGRLVRDEQADAEPDNSERVMRSAAQRPVAHATP